MTAPAAIEGLLIAVSALMVGEKLWKYLMVVQFFRQATRSFGNELVGPIGAGSAAPDENSVPPDVSILQPILSGDPTLPWCLEQNLRSLSGYRRETLWLVDEDDFEGQRICGELIARYPGSDIALILTPPPPDRVSPKTFKLIIGAERARGGILSVLDDDTMLPDYGLDRCVLYLDRPGVGLAFGLPYYVNFSNFWSSLVSCFVNSNSLLTYVPYTYLIDPFTINGMFFVAKRGVLEGVGGFQGLETELMDDFAIAQRFRSYGFRLAQTPVLHGISTRVDDSRHYFRLLHRWFIFPRETVLKALPFKELMIAYGLGLGASLFPLLFLILLCVRHSWTLAGLFSLYITISFGIFCHIQRVFLPRPTPIPAYWMAPVIQLILPFQMIAALLTPATIFWRGHVMQIEPGGRFRFVRRRAASADGGLNRSRDPATKETPE